MAELPSKADIVIIGQGGIVGASVAYHLVEKGWTNIVGIDKSAIPTDIGSTSHASDFCFMTAQDRTSCWTTRYSVEFYEKLGHYARVGGLEVARHDDPERMEELKRKIGAGKCFGTRVEMIDAKTAKQKFPLLEEGMIQGAMWDPDAGLVVPRSQTVVSEIVERAVATGKLKIFPNNPATGLEIDNDRILGVHTAKGYIRTDHVVVCAGLWGRIIAQMAGEDLPMMPVDHPLCFFGPYRELEGTGKEIGFPLLRDQGNSAYLRDTGDPLTTEGGQIEWGYYEETEPRLVHPHDLLEKEEARLSPSQRDLDVEQVIGPLERAMEITPILAELGFDSRHSFNGLLQVTTDAGSVVGESPHTRGIWYAEAIWVKDGPGIGKIVADLLTDGVTDIDIHNIDIARFYPMQKTRSYIHNRCYESALKIYNPAVHDREPYTKGRQLRRSPFWSREQELGGYFMEVAGWERAHGYAANDHLIEKYSDRVPVRQNEWDSRHFWRVSNAEHLAMSDHAGMINLSHFAIYDISGKDAERLMEYLCVAKVGGTTPVGKGIYTHFLDQRGGIRADLTVLRLGEDDYRVIDGADAGHRDYIWMTRTAADLNLDVRIEDRSDHLACLGLWGPEARNILQSVADDPDALENENFAFATARHIAVRGIPVHAFRISFVGEQGWELHVPFSYGLSLWDLIFDTGAIPVGIETYANSRRLEKGFRLQNADLLTEYNLFEAGLARPRIKDAEFLGKSALSEQSQRPQQIAYLSTLVITDNTDAKGVARYPIGACPILDPGTQKVLADSLGRRSYSTSIAFGPSVGNNIVMGYLPAAYAEDGRELLIEYFGETYPARVTAVGCKGLYDPDNLLPRS